jgi:hypothetical protein
MLLGEWMDKNGYIISRFSQETGLCATTIVRAKRNRPVFQQTIDKIFEFTKGEVQLTKKVMPEIRRKRVNEQEKKTRKAFCLRRYYNRINDLPWPAEWKKFSDFVKLQGLCPDDCEYFCKKDSKKPYSPENFCWTIKKPRD